MVAITSPRHHPWLRSTRTSPGQAAEKKEQPDLISSPSAGPGLGRGAPTPDAEDDDPAERESPPGRRAPPVPLAGARREEVIAAFAARQKARGA